MPQLNQESIQTVVFNRGLSEASHIPQQAWKLYEITNGMLARGSVWTMQVHGKSAKQH
jgi:hypothetical protein